MRVKLTDKGVYAPQNMTKEEDAMAHALLTGGWIEHHGKGYPDLPMDTLVQVRFSDGDETGPDGLEVEWWGVNWRHDNPLHWADITHYRVVKP